jgi:conjugative relaxase-like TrwC/TraI family protein
VVVGVTVSMRVMSAGAGYRYLLDSVAMGDGRRAPGRPLVGYYAEPGCPPGRWLGSGCATLAAPLRPGSVVEEEQLALLLGEGRDPTSGVPLGRAYPRFVPTAQRIATRSAALDPDLDETVRAAAVARITVEEQARGTRRAVAGYDLTFSVPKSVSVLWALADPDTRRQIVAAHHAAIDDVIRLVERDVAATRIGATGPDGPVAQIDVHGVIAAAFDHYDSRAGDPQLHTHVVIANKVQAVTDGRWRALDGRPIHAAVVALSEHYNAVLADHLTNRLGVTWTQRHRGPDRNPQWEITGVPDHLLDAFSSRSTAINHDADELVTDYLAAHGRRPSARTRIRLRQQATLRSRPDKQLRSLAELTDRWHTAAGRLLDTPPGEWTRALLAGRRVQQRLHAADVSTQTVHGVAGRVLEVVGERRSTWRRWNLHAEASRQLQGVRFATTADRETVLHQVVNAAERQSVQLTPADLAPVPADMLRSDGTSVLRPRHSTLYTSRTLLDAEDRLLHLSRTTTGARVPVGSLAAVADGLGDDKAAAALQVCTSGRVVDVLVGPAGAGKTTAMRAVREAWSGLYGSGSVVGVAPSAAAAEVLSATLAAPADTLAKWLHDHQAGKAGLRAGQLVIVDEASLAGTVALHRLAVHADTVGAKVLLVGDPAQLTAVDAGGALALLAADRSDVAQLTGVHRFAEPWEAAATLQLRDGDPVALDIYAAHGRLLECEGDVMLDAAYRAWHSDLAAGRSSLLIAPTREQVAALNRRAQADRVAAGHVTLDRTVGLHDGEQVGVGDAVVTRRNDRRLSSSSGRWVRNGDRWTVNAVHIDGSLTAQLAGSRSGGSVRLPAGYVAEHVELGYATTVHRAQGATVDTAHAIVTSSMTREALYVAMTRGRHTNTAYTCTDAPDGERHHDQPAVTGRSVLEQVLATAGAELSAHHVLRAAQDRAGSIAQLAAEYDTIATAAQRTRWTSLLHATLTADQADQVIASEAFGPLCAALRRADAHHLPPERLLPRLLEGRPVDEVANLAAVLHHRLDTVVLRAAPDVRRPAPRLVVGLFPAADGSMSAEARNALQERQRLMEARARELAAIAIAERAPWVQAVQPAPSAGADRARWIAAVCTIAAYRDRHGLGASYPLASVGATDGGRHVVVAAQRAERLARWLAQASHAPGNRTPTAGLSRSGVSLSACGTP